MLIGTGSEVQHCVGAAKELDESGVSVRVVSLPVLGMVRAAGRGVPGRDPAARRPDAERGGGGDLRVESLRRRLRRPRPFRGLGARGEVAMEKFGFTVDHVVERARALLAPVVAQVAAPRNSPHPGKGARRMTRLQDLYDIAGQSPWLDNLRRDWLQDGQLADLVQKGVRGITSNPTIFANAISGQDTYDDQFKALMKDHTVESAYWELAISDIEDGLELLRPTYDDQRRRGRVRLAGGLPRPGPRHGQHRARRPHAARSHRGAQPVGQGAGHQGVRARPSTR